MRKSWWYRLFRLGAIPREWRRRLAAESVLVQDEGMPGRMITADVRGPGKRFRGRSEGFSGWLAVTRKRVVFHTFGRRQINVGFGDPRLRRLVVERPGPESLSIRFESGEFLDGWSGEIEFRLRTARAGRFAEALAAAGASLQR